MRALLNKLRPPMPAALTARESLVARLASDVEAHRITAVIAPAGFGKTALALATLRFAPGDVAWLTLDRRDNSLFMFALYVVAALQHGVPGVGADVMAALGSGPLPDVDTLADLLIDSLAGLGSSLWLVLDDLHVVTDESAQVWLRTLVEHLPPEVHVLVTSRHDAPFPTRWKVQGWLTEFRAADLRFSAEESRVLLRERLGPGASEDVIARLVQRCEGWAAGLQLAALALRDEPDPVAFARRFDGSQRDIADYLHEEVLVSQPHDLRQFLERTSILERLTAPLCEALTGRRDSADVLAQLAAGNAFVMDLGEGTFRYHDLFAEMLRIGLEPDERRRLHGQAAEACLRLGLRSEAIQHFIAAGQADRAEACVAEYVLPALKSDDLLTLRILIEQLPRGSSGQPLLRLARSWFAAHAHQTTQATQLLDSLENEELDAEARAWAGGVRALIAYQARDLEAVLPLVEAARDLPQAGALSGMFDWLSGAALWEQGQSAQALARIRSALRTPSIVRVPFGYAGITFFLIDYLHQLGRRDEAWAVCDHALTELVDAVDNPLVYAAPVTVQAGLLHYDADELDAAESFLRSALSQSQPLSLAQGIVLAHGYVALCAAARGDAATSGRELQAARRSADRADAQPLALVVEGIASSLDLRRGDDRAMRDWLRDVPADLCRLPLVAMETAVRGLVQVEGELARARLERCAEQTRARGQVRRLIPIEIGLALLHDRAGRTTLARETLTEAVTLAARSQARRAFLDDSPHLLSLLPDVRAAAPDFIDSLLGHSSSPAGPVEPLLDRLTDRERVILQLAADGYSNREIAVQLVVAVSTVKSHIKHVFSKLGADSRTRAIARARALGLVTRH